MKKTRIDRQPYADCTLSAGLIDGHPTDSIYLQFKRSNKKPATILLRRDEAVRIAAMLANAVWSDLLRRGDT